jgi:type III pantothenate kinase
MNLIVDIGNSYWKIALFDNNKIVKRAEIPDADTTFVQDFLDGMIPAAIGFSSVRDSGESEKTLFGNFGPVYSISVNDPLPVTLDYKTPQTLGTDRISAAVFGKSVFPRTNLLIITLGTCITSDILTDKGVFLGGTISPGPQMRLSAMHSFTGKLPELEFTEDVVLPGISTDSCMHAGAWHGVLAEVEYYIAYYKQQFPGLHVIVSGGFAPFFEKKIKYPIFAQNDIVLKGLNEILNYQLGHIEK